MQLSGLPTLLTTERLQRYVTDTRRELETAQTEAVTGFSADVTKRLDGDIRRLLELDKLIEDGNRRLDSINAFKSEASIVQLALQETRTAISSVAIDTESALELQNQEGMEAMAVTAAAELDSLNDKLNLSISGRALFSGAATSTRAVADFDTVLADVKAIISAGPNIGTANVALDTYFNDPTGTFQTTIYQGSAALAPDREASPNARLGIETTVLDPAILDSIRGLAVIAASADRTIGNEYLEDMVRDSKTRLSSAESRLVTIETRLGAQEAVAERIETRTRAAQTVYELNRIDLVGVDQFEAASRLNTLETQLQASYLVTNQIQNLSLVNFLR